MILFHLSNPLEDIKAVYNLLAAFELEFLLLFKISFFYSLWVLKFLDKVGDYYLANVYLLIGSF